MLGKPENGRTCKQVGPKILFNTELDKPENAALKEYNRIRQLKHQQMELSETIKSIRLELGLSQEGLARELHVGFTSVNRWENNHTKPNQIARHALVGLCKNNNVNPMLVAFLLETR